MTVFSAPTSRHEHVSRLLRLRLRRTTETANIELAVQGFARRASEPMHFDEMSSKSENADENFQ